MPYRGNGHAQHSAAPVGAPPASSLSNMVKMANKIRPRQTIEVSKPKSRRTRSIWPSRPVAVSSEPSQAQPMYRNMPMHH